MKTLNRAVAILCAASACLVTAGPARAQFGGVGEIGLSTSLGAGIDASAASNIRASSIAGKVNPNRNIPNPGDIRNEMIGDVGYGGPSLPSPVFGQMSQASAPAAPAAFNSSGPLRWNKDTGADILRELLTANTYSAPGHRVRVVRTITRRNGRRRRVTVSVAKFQGPPPNWIYHYLPEDRYKVMSGVWKYVSTESDRYYYPAWAPGVLRQSAGKVIGFYTWQDAMIAGYRPDPSTKPTPAAQLVDLAHVTKGPDMLQMVEYIYSGQMTPETFDASYRYLKSVEAAVNSEEYTKPYLQPTMAQAISAVMGRGQAPVSVGPQAAGGSAGTVQGGYNGFGPPPGVPGPPSGYGPPPGVPGPPQGYGGPVTYNSGPLNGPTGQGTGAFGQGVQDDTRTQAFDNFSQRAGGLAATGANRNRNLGP